MNTAEADADAEKGPVKIVSLFDAALHEDEEQPKRHGSPLWMTTFADMITLLLAFFVLILSFSDTNANRFKDVSGALQKSLSMDLVGKKVQLRTDNGKLVVQLPARGSGIMPQEMLDLYGRIADAQAQIETRVEIREGGEEDERRNDTARQLKQLREMLAGEIAKGEAQVEHDGERIVIRMVVQGSFYSGSADLSPDFMPMLRKIGRSIAAAGGRITVEGHTDDIPLNGHNRYRSNWDLSGARAASVADYLTEQAGVPRERVIVRGMADTKPLAPNDTREGRAKNRRIEVLVDAFGA